MVKDKRCSFMAQAGFVMYTRAPAVAAVEGQKTIFEGIDGILPATPEFACIHQFARTVRMRHRTAKCSHKTRQRALVDFPGVLKARRYALAELKRVRKAWNLLASSSRPGDSDCVEEGVKEA